MNIKKILFIFLLLLLSSCSTTYEPVRMESENKNYQTLTIDLKGEVLNPGFYSVPSGMMLYELIELAGGLTSKADSSSIMMVSVIESNQSIIIPSVNPIDQNKNEQVKPISLNKASVQELMGLPGIGKAKAEAIITYRNEKGSFLKIEDLMKVPGIGENLFNSVKAQLIL